MAITSWMVNSGGGKVSATQRSTPVLSGGTCLVSLVSTNSSKSWWAEVLATSPPFSLVQDTSGSSVGSKDLPKMITSCPIFSWRIGDPLPS